MRLTICQPVHVKIGIITMAHKEHFVDINTGLIVYRDTHTTPGRLAYIGLYREIGHTEWKKRFKEIRTGAHIHGSTPESELKIYGLLEEHYTMLIDKYGREAAALAKSIEGYEADLTVVSESSWLIEEELYRLREESASLERCKTIYENKLKALTPKE
jgi:hypothetical protein